jgi:DNA-directed RNA polymerase specialized sigma24 family protein
MAVRAEPSDKAHLGEKTTTDWQQSAYLPRIVGLIAKQCGVPAADIPDVLQEVRLAIWRIGPTTWIEPRWIAQTARHKAVDSLRRLIRTRDLDRLAGATPQVTLVSAELHHLLCVAVSLLPPELQDFYEVRYKQGCSEREIATRWGICRASVRWLDKICRRRLSGLLGSSLGPLRIEPSKKDVAQARASPRLK